MSKINLQEMFLKQVQSAYKIELAKAEKCCESCRDRMLESQIYFEYGYTAALSDLQDKVEKLVECLDFYVTVAKGYDIEDMAKNALAEFKNGEDEK